MSYTSIVFYVLLVILLLLYYVIPQKGKWIVLLAGSFLFYYFVCTDKRMLLLFGATIVISYLFGLLLQDIRRREASDTALKCTLFAGIIVSIAPLLLSKIGTLFFTSILHKPGIAFLIPVGLSFYSLQIISYLTDIYRGDIECQRNFLKYALFISFFPQIIQGPIPRYSQLQHQLLAGHTFEESNLMGGIQLVIWGFFLKYMIADKAGIIVNEVFDNYTVYSGVYIWIAAILYSIQLYADFMSCVTLSRGCAQMFGIHLVDNFKRPYFSGSIKDFWRRWHISLSFFFRDYLYIPLGGNRKGKVRKYLNLLITFLISGLWHGGSLNFIFWGFLHGIYQVIGEITSPIRDFVLTHLALPKHSKMRKLLQILTTDFLVMMGWVFFRAVSLKAGFSMVKSMFLSFNPWVLFDDSLYRLGLSQKECGVLLASVLLLLIVSFLQERGKQLRAWFASQNVIIRYAIYLCAIWCIWIFGTYGYGYDANAFIYGGF